MTPFDWILLVIVVLTFSTSVYRAAVIPELAHKLAPVRMRKLVYGPFKVSVVVFLVLAWRLWG